MSALKLSKELLTTGHEVSEYELARCMGSFSKNVLKNVLKMFKNV